MSDWYKFWVLQTAVASLQSPDCDTEWLIGINFVCCRQQVDYLHLEDCENEWPVGINVATGSV